VSVWRCGKAASGSRAMREQRVYVSSPVRTGHRVRRGLQLHLQPRTQRSLLDSNSHTV